MEALIYEVQRRNVLWNKKNPRYKDRLIVDKEWDAVVHNTGLSKEEAKRKWRNLRDQFAKELKKVRKPHSGDGAAEDGQYTGKWQYFANLQFLQCIVAPRSTEGNVPHSEVLQNSETSLVENEDMEKEDSEDDNCSPSASSPGSVTLDYSQVVATAIVPHEVVKHSVLQENANSGGLQQQRKPVSEPRNIPSLSNKTSRSKRKIVREENMDVEEQLLNIEAKKLALLEQRTGTPEDENSLFLRSLLPYFQKMDPLQQLRVRTKFQEILIQEMSPQATSVRPCNTYFPLRPSTAMSSVPSSSAYSNMSSPASPTEGFSNFSNMYSNNAFTEGNLN